MQSPITESQFETIEMLSEISGHVGMDYPMFPVSRYLARIVKDFVFSFEKEASAENTISSNETPLSKPTKEPPAREPILSLFLIENSAAI